MKKIILLLVVTIATNFYVLESMAINPIISLDEAERPAPENNEKVFLKYAEECLGIIEQAAQKIPMTGVAMVAFIPGDVSVTWLSKMKVVGKLSDDKANLLGIVYTKAAEMAVTLQDSGNPDRKNMRGEYGYIGGVIRKVKGGYVLGAFSGGKGEDDAAAAKMGVEWLASKFK